MSEYYNNNANANGEILDSAVIGADQLGDYQSSGSEFILLQPGDYDFTVVNLEQSRYTPGPNSKIGSCKQVTVTLRVIDPASGKNVDLRHNLYMWSSTLGLIAQYYDSIGIHKHGDPLQFDWRMDLHIGKTGRLKLDNKLYKNRKTGQELPTNNIVKLYPKEASTQQPTQQPNNWKRGW